MSQIEIFTTPHQITPEWLTDVLRSTQTIAQGRIESISVEPLTEGIGYTGQLALLKINYGELSSEGPATVFCKLSSNDEQVFNTVSRLGIYEREVRFYEELAHIVPIRTPRRYLSQFDASSGRSILLLEDMNPARPGDQIAGCTPHEAELVVSSAARIHSQWWNSNALNQYAWLVPWSSTADLYQQMYRESLQKFLNTWGHLVEPEVINLCHRIAPHVASIRKATGESPQTLLHGDFRLDNFMFGTAEDSFDLALVDWQLCNTGNGMCDVAYFISGAIGPDGRREQECQLLDVYYSTLVANGVENYTKESCIRDYKLALLDRIPFRVIAWGLLDFSNARGRRLIEVSLSRFSPALIENNIEEMIPRD